MSEKKKNMTEEKFEYFKTLSLNGYIAGGIRFVM